MKPILVRESAIPLVHFSASTRRGSIADPEGKEGALRLLLRLMRRSTKGLTAEQVDERLDTLGATLGIEISRSTTGFTGSCIRRSLDAYLELAEGIITCPQFAEDEFERLKSETLAEWVESLDNDSALARRYFNRRFFADHPYGRLTAGTPSSLDAIQLSDLKELHAAVFKGKAPLIAFAGDVDEVLAESFSARLVRDLGPVPSAAEVKDPFDDPKGPSGRHLTFVDKPSRTQTQILMGCLGTHPADQDHMALFVGHTIFGGTFGARLSREVRGKRGWSYGAYSDLPFDRRRQVFSLWTFPQGSDAANCIRLELELLEALISHGVKKSELSATKKYLSNSNVFSSDTAAKRAAAALDREIYGLPDDYHSSFVERVNAITLDEVNEALKNRLSSENLEITVVGTFDTIGAEIRDAIPALAGCDVIPFDARD